MGVRDFVAGIFQPAADLVDELHTSGEEAGSLRNALAGVQAAMLGEILQYRAEIAQLRAKIVNAEATQGNLLQRSWRPMIMLWFAWLLGQVWYGNVPPYLEANPDLIAKLFDLLQIGIGGYIGGRTVEKVAPSIAQVFARTRGDRDD